MNYQSPQFSRVHRRRARRATAHPNRPCAAAEMGTDPGPQRYDLSNDIGEQKNLAPQQPSRVARMAAHLEKLRANAR